MQNLDILKRCKNINKQTKLKTNTILATSTFTSHIVLSNNFLVTNGPQKPSAQHNHSRLDATLGGCSHAKGHISF
jgi:hypothetical protein